VKQHLIEWIGAVNLEVRRWVDGQECRWCDAPATGICLCVRCAADLPWIEHACPNCARPQLHDQPCAACAKRPPAFDAAWAAFRFEAPIHRCILGLKYRASFVDARMLGNLLSARLHTHRDPLPQLLLPVPLHRRRLVQRGYNQALEVAHIVGKALSVPVAHDVALRVRATEDQIGKTAAQRRRNVRGAFALRGSVEGLHVALFDDVMTTGATLGELARVCRAGGAARVEAWSIARAP
jgi:ComF family protein